MPSRRQYFVPAEGISNEVIQANICRYLGPDATVRSCKMNGNSGFLIESSLTPTVSVVTDMKNDSKSWEKELARSRRSRGDEQSQPLPFGSPGAHWGESNFKSGKALDITESPNEKERSKWVQKIRDRYDHSSEGQILPPARAGSANSSETQKSRADREYLSTPPSYPRPSFSQYFVEPYTRQYTSEPRDGQSALQRLSTRRDYTDSRDIRSTSQAYHGPSTQQDHSDPPEGRRTARGYHSPWNQRHYSLLGPGLDRPSTSPGPFRRQGRLLQLPLLLNNERFIALPDSGATKNLITTAAVDFLGLRATQDCHSFVIANRRSFTSIGKVNLACSFMDLPEKPSTEEFSVVDKLVDGVSTIFGLPSLKKWKIYGRYQFRLEERTLKLGPRVALMASLPAKSSSTWTAFQIRLNGSVESSFPDTGSDIDLVSEDWVKLKGLQPSPLEFGDCYRVQFADGTQHPLSLKVVIHFDTLSHRPLELEDVEADSSSSPPSSTTFDRDRRDAYEESSRRHIQAWKPKASDQYRTFYVCKDLPYDVILGQQLLDAIDAYRTHEDAFITVVSDGRDTLGLTTEKVCQDRLNVIKSSGWLSRLTGREVTVTPSERTAFLTYLQREAQNRNSTQIDHELTQLIQLHERIVDYERAIELETDSRQKRDYREQKKVFDDGFRARADTIRQQLV